MTSRMQGKAGHGKGRACAVSEVRTPAYEMSRFGEEKEKRVQREKRKEEWWLTGWPLSSSTHQPLGTLVDGVDGWRDGEGGWCDVVGRGRGV